MKIRVVRTDDAVGKIIAYDTTASTPSFKGAIIKKGKRLTPEDIEILKDNGHYYVYVYDEGEETINEVHEDEAVLRLAQSLSGRNITASNADEGKAIMKSVARGLLLVNTKLLYDINKHGVFVVITRRTGTLVDKDEKVGIVDLIPFSIPVDVMNHFLSLASIEGPLIEVREIVTTRIGLVATGTELYEGRKKDLSEEILRKKAQVYGFELTEKIIVPDDPEMIRKAILSLLMKNDAVVITGGMSVDPNDYTPKVIASIADEVVAYGIPVKPITMTMVAYLEGKPIIGVSGGIIHYPDYNILDILLPWVLSRTRITREYLLSLAHGGLSDYYLSKHKD
ncbi:MAG: molybdopterin-binding protein [Fervidicoccaceae archaeon]